MPHCAPQKFRLVNTDPLKHIDRLHYCINCVDSGSGFKGTFAYDYNLCEKNSCMFAISPVFEDVMSFYEWAKLQGFRYYDLGNMLTLYRNFV